MDHGEQEKLLKKRKKELRLRNIEKSIERLEKKFEKAFPTECDHKWTTLDTEEILYWKCEECGKRI